MPSTDFGRLLKGAINSIATYEGKTAPIIEDELGAQIGLAGATIQRYKTGHLPPEARSVQILAEAAIKRGYLNREWLQRFLHAARYPAPEKLLDQLCPTGTVRERPQRVYENLPPPIYSQFVMRAQAFSEIIDGLNRRSAVVLVASLGGMGKTSLAREIAARCLQGSDDLPQFDAVVWVSDKDRPGTTTFSTVLDTIAQTLDYPGFTQFAHDEKQYEVEQLLRRQRVLLVVDNAETIRDGVLLTWLLRQLPAPSKALVTAREYRREFRDGAIPIDVRGMTDAEAWQLMTERLSTLKLDKAVRERAQLEPLIRVTGGNPKALEMALGLMKYQRQPLQQVIDDLYAARGDLFDDLFARAWSLLDEAARRVLLITPLFVDSAGEEALAQVADVQGFACTRAIEQLTDLALLDVQQVDLGSPVRYTTHRLVRTFAGAKLTERAAFEQEARERWVQWAFGLIGQVGNCFANDPQFELMDLDQRTCYAAIEWAADYSSYEFMFDRLDRSECYYTFRGHWYTMRGVYLLWIKAAQRLSNPVEEFRGIAAYMELSLLQSNSTEVESYFNRLHTLDATNLPDKEHLKYLHTLARHALVKENIAEAQRLWQEADRFQQERAVKTWINVRIYVATCFYRQGDLDHARNLFLSVLEESVAKVDKLNIIHAQIGLAQIDLDQMELASAERRITFLFKQKRAHREQLPSREWLAARLFTLQGNYAAAREAFGKAIDTFERMGMRRELAEARAELAALEAQLATA